MLGEISAMRKGAQTWLATVAALLAACVPAGDEPATENARPARPETNLFAEAEIAPLGDSDVRGLLRFDQDAEFLWISGRMSGLQPGTYLLHVHERQHCPPTPGGSAGPVFSLDRASEDVARDPESPKAAGNLGEIVADEDGHAEFEMVETVLEIGSGERSVTNHSIVVHRAHEASAGMPDVRAGKLIGCGSIKATPTPTYVP